MKNLALLIPPLILLISGSGVTLSDPLNIHNRNLSLQNTASFILEDESTPIEFLYSLVVMNQELLQVDSWSRVVRRFDKNNGQLLGYLVPPDPQDRWKPYKAQVDQANGNVLVSSHGIIYRYHSLLEKPNVCFDASKKGFFAHNFFVGPTGKLYSSEPRYKVPYSIQALLPPGEVVKSILEWDENAAFLDGHFGQSAIGFLEDASMIAVRCLDPTFFHYTEEGELIASYQAPTNPHYRYLPKSINPKTERSPDVLIAWERTFSIAREIITMPELKILLIYTQNAPPDRPNTLDVLDANFNYLGRLDVEGYVIGADATGLYLCDKYKIIRDGKCKIERKEIVLGEWL